MDDERIIDLFFERSEQAITEVENKYGRLMMKIAMNALGSEPDAEECVNDALLGLWHAIPPARPGSLRAFACRIVRNISINRYKSKAFEHKRNGLEECLEELEGMLGSPGLVEDEAEGALLSEQIGDFLRTRCELDQMIFVRRFFYFDTCSEAAKTAGISCGAVRARLFKMKAALKKYLKERGIVI